MSVVKCKAWATKMVRRARQRIQERKEREEAEKLVQAQSAQQANAMKIINVSSRNDVNYRRGGSGMSHERERRNTNRFKGNDPFKK
jgi:hypothetical protein